MKTKSFSEIIKTFRHHFRFQLIVTIDTNEIALSQRLYLLLLLDLLTESPIRRPEDNVLIPHEEVVAALESETISAIASVGIEKCKQFSGGTFAQTVALIIKVEHSKYVCGVKWIVDLLQNTEFTAERIRVCSSKISNAVAQAKRNGNSVTHDLLKAIFYTSDSNIRATSMLQQHRFLTSVLEKLDTENGAADVINDLNNLRSEILSPNRLGIYVAGDWAKIKALEDIDLVQPWASLVKETTVAQYVTLKQRKVLINIT